MSAPHLLDRSALLGALDDVTSAFAATLAAMPAGGPGSAVPTCPDWCVADLVDHLGRVHGWAAAAARGGAADRPPPMPEPLLPPPAPVTAEALSQAYAAAAQELLDTLRSTDPDAPCWHFGPRPRTSGWWARRQLHETTVHLVDLQLALGGPVTAVPPAVAVDGLDEVATFFVPRQVSLGRTPAPPYALRLVTRESAEPLVLGEGEPGATLTGSAGDLLLVLWRRTGLDAVQVDGDPAPVLDLGLVP